MWDISELNLSLLFLSEIDKYVKSMFAFSDAENIIKSFLHFLSGCFLVFARQVTLYYPHKNDKTYSKETIRNKSSKRMAIRQRTLLRYKNLF